MKKTLLFSIAILGSLCLYGQYEGKPWNGAPWKFGQDNYENLETGRVIGYKYDVGPGMSGDGVPGGAVEAPNNLVWVVAHRQAGGANQWRTRLTDGVPAAGWNTRLLQAEEKNIELDPTDVALVTGWSNFQWDLQLNRFRDGGSWFRYTLEFEEGLYRFINRGYPNTNGNFDLRIALRNPETMELIWTSDWYNNLKDENVRTFRLTTDAENAPAPPYDLLGPSGHANQAWWILNEVLELNGTYVIEIEQRNAGALGGQFSEFTFEALPLDSPTITSVETSAESVDGCDGAVTITVNTTPYNEGGQVEYQLFLDAFPLFSEWTTENTFEVFWPGNYTIRAREVGFVIAVEESVELAKINCEPTPFMEQAQTIPGTVEFEYFDKGGYGIAYREITTPFNNAQNWTDRNEEEYGKMGVDVRMDAITTETETDTTSVEYVTITDLGNIGRKTSEWTVYSVKVEESGDFQVTMNYFSNVNVGRDMQLAFYTDDMSEVIDSLNLRIYGNWELWDQDSVDENYRPIPADVLDRYVNIAYEENPISLPAGNYKLKFYSNGFNFRLDNLEFEKLDDIAMTLWVEETTVQQTVPFRISTPKNADVYIVPAGTSPTDNIAELSIASRGIIANDTVNFATTEIDPGEYLMYAIDKLGNVSDPVNVIVEALVRPVITIKEWQVFPGYPFEITMDMDGMVYLVPEGTEQGDPITAVALKSESVTADAEVEMFSDGLDLGNYVLYGVNTMGIVSDGVDVMVTTAVGIENPIAESIRIYPVPASLYIHIESATAISFIEVYSLLGTRVLAIDKFEGKIDVSQFRKGIYFIKVTTEDTLQSTHRIIIQ